MKEQKPERIIVAAKTAAGKTSFITEADKLHKTLFITSDQIADPVTNDLAGTATVINTDPVPDAKAEIVHQPESVAKVVALVKPPVQPKSVTNTPSLEKAHQYSFAPVQQAPVHEPVVSQPEEISSGIKDIYPLSIESVINAYSYQPKKKRISWQVYFTPTISYRELKENKAFINSARNNTATTNNAVPNSYYATDINNLVTHKPDVGLQLGFTAGYPLSKNLKLIGGLQFNVSKYDIKAYTFPSEVATIALRNTAGGTNTISTVTNYRNTGGYKANWLHNLYFSASAPIGLEMKLIGNRKTYMGISGTVQPTYMISNRSYLLTTDYKNYAEMPSLIRKWNINTAFEVFAGYSTGKLKWRVGPQVRYQAMSSFQKKYPVQEHLFDFGLKLGVLFNQ